jgi:hypothetical protein
VCTYCLLIPSIWTHEINRWIGGSSTQTLIETFRNEIAGTEDLDGTPSSDLSDGPNMLYFPTGLGFGKLRALPSAEEVEYPERDLADNLVSTRPLGHAHDKARCTPAF